MTAAQASGAAVAGRVARIAADRALRVPGVLGLRGDLAAALRDLASTVLGRPGRVPGASAQVTGGAAEVQLGLVTALGHNCRELAQQVQRDVAAEVSARTGLSARVRVTVVEVRSPEL